MNRLPGRIIEIKSSDNIRQIQLSVDGDIFTALMIGTEEKFLEVGKNVYILFKETELSIGKEISGVLSIRNRFRGIVESIDIGNLLTEITIQYKSFKIKSIITTQSAIELQLKPKDEVEGLLKSNELMISKV